MLRVRFDVNDTELRQALLDRSLFEALAALGAESRPAWGRMSAQQMVEHLAWVFETSTGRARVDCTVPEARRERFKAFLYDNRPMLREFVNPALTTGLPRLRHGSLREATAALRVECDRCLDSARGDPAVLHTHPVFGPLGPEEWERSHFKHVYHHLEQFGLITPP